MVVNYSLSEAQRNLAVVLDKATAEGEVRITRRDGQVYVVRPLQRTSSPLDIQSIDLGVTTEEIINFIAEGRRPYGSEADEPGLQ